jgi:membrane fusion protein, multidrug efflux system
MRLRTWRGTTVVNQKPRHPFPWLRTLIVLLVLGIAAYLIVPNVYYVRADALVRGDLIPVTPVYRVRLDRLLVGCTDRVVAGEPVAVVSNFLLQADYQRDYLQSLEEQQVAQVQYQQNVATAQANAETFREKYQVAAVDERRLDQEMVSFDDAYKAGAIPFVDWQAKRTEVQAAKSATQAALSAWQRAELFVKQVEASSTGRMSSYQLLLTQAQATATRVGSERLYAPVTGDIVECVPRPQNVIEPGTAIFNIFQPDRAYIVAYFSPGEISNVHLGQTADITIAGLPHKVRGRVTWIYPELDALPPELTLFFWQHVQFSEYHPVKITLEDVPESERQLLYYNAHARVVIRRDRSTA